MSLEPDNEPVAISHNDGDLLLYDYFKHVTSLSILALGGILLITQSLGGEALEKWKIYAVFMLVSVGGIIAFHGASEVVKAKTSGNAVGKSIYRMRSLAPIVLGAGVGVFLSLFTDALEHM